ncbi:NACHT domain-containing protein [Acaryochloris marina NIES-2412]|uniref:NACHT domain-containing protein n=1 Tax=Acaryochloris marina TaxID=155978 RepID=UPI00405A1E8D
MSIAGIRSNRGDIYQTFIAFDWALTVLSDPEYQWIEVDSTTYLVDDVVIGRSDGSVICCQCKKNQANFRAWSIADLAGELQKAFPTLTRNQQVQVRFYSRSEFGAIAKLREYSTSWNNEADYLANLTEEHTETDRSLTDLISAQTFSLSNYEFLRRTSFEISPGFDRMKMLLSERLRQMVSNSDAAFNALWTSLDNLGGHVESTSLSASIQYRLTNDDIKNILHDAGAMLVPVMDMAQVRTSFCSTSAIGRSWHRDIAGHRIPSLVVNELLDAIDARKRSILLTGRAGSGKTCQMLSLQEALEQRTQTQADLVPLFIQSREFADLPTVQDRQAQGLSEQWVEQTARLAEDAYVVVIIDSLDVLSIAREHSVLTYFLAQIDRLLRIPNVTVVTACRDFDHKYDRRISIRQWDYELQCPLLEWESEIVPLFNTLEIDSTSIDVVTRELIRNPRELALFVELAQLAGSFNVVTSQALAQRYLDTIVQSDPALGDAAMLAIETIADEMLKSRSLSIPRQRFNASQDILRRLHSLNVLQDTHDGKLTFGHQTLLDVLVISSAVREGISLNEFIQSLTPVPFVRPSIRSFVAQLATGGRHEFRKQLRTVLTGSAAFHIRSLIAKSFAQQRPHNDDWPLIRDLRDNHREVFQVIYAQASLVEWHHFWSAHLVPVLKEMQDAERLIAHVYLVKQWKNEDAAGVLAFWTEALEIDWLDHKRIAAWLSSSLTEFKTENLTLVAPLLERLMSMPIPEHSFLGCTVADCVTAGSVDDRLLWRYIAGDISEEDVGTFEFGNKLRCQPHEFGSKNENFLNQRMVQSTTLLELALEAIEQWSQVKSTRYNLNRTGYRNEFLDKTSFNDAHSQIDYQYVDSVRDLLNAIEFAILDHAQKDSDWWERNRERLCFNQEGALTYFAVLALTKSPQPNIELISRLLCERDLLEFDLNFELGTLIHTSFIYLDRTTQDLVMELISTLWEEYLTDERTSPWVLKQRAEYLSAIPCYLRSPETQAIVDAYEQKHGTLIRQPFSRISGGVVTSPFSFEVFLSASDNGVIHLLWHYSEYNGDFDNFPVGGNREVGLQLHEASSRHPSRFLKLLIAHWSIISASSRDDIMQGITNHLAYRYGNLRPNDTPDNKWTPVEEPDASNLASQILEELERHPSHWWLNRCAAEALKACAYVIQDEKNAARLVFWTIGFGSLREKSTIRGGPEPLLTAGINMMTGRVAEALMILVNNLQKHDSELPELLAPTLCRFASNENPEIRAVVLKHLPYLQNKNPELGWKIFNLAMQDSTELWKYSKHCLYYAYRDHFDKVLPLLERIRREGSEADMETWGRISALSALNGHIDFFNLLDDLNTFNIAEAWQGAASVWTHTGNIKQHREQCLKGIKAGLKASTPHSISVAQKVENIFRDNTPPISIPLDLIQLHFDVCENDSQDGYTRIFRFDEWLNAISQRNPEYALATTEIYLNYINRTQRSHYDYKDQLVQLLTRLFAEAEEREESDQGAMLNRVVSAQDLLLSMGVDSINNWLKIAERK